MAVYIGEPFQASRAVGRHRAGTWWSQLIADTPEELDAIAAEIGLRRSWRQDRPGRPPYYTLTATKRELAIKHGALACDGNKAWATAWRSARVGAGLALPEDR